MRNKLMSITVIVALLFSMLSTVAMESASANSNLEVAATHNVALHAQATTSGECSVSENGSMAVDGRTDTKWCDSSSSQKKWLQLDLGQTYNMNEWVVQSAAIGESSSRPFRNTKDFRLQISADGDTWVDIDEVKDNVQTIVKRYVPTFTARY